MQIKVLTYNIHHGEGREPGISGFSGKPDLDRIARVIRRTGADIVGLQEVDRGHERSGFADQPTMLGKLLDMNVCFGRNVTWSDGSEYGVAILSRFPIRSHMRIGLPSHHRLEPRGILQAVIEIPDVGDLTIFNTHLQHAEGEHAPSACADRRNQASFLAGIVKTSETPVVVMGDMNAEPEDDELEPLTEVVLDVWSTAGEGDGLTYPADPDAPLATRIDSIWSRPPVVVSNIHVVLDDDSRIGSDHYPVFATLEVPQASVAAEADDHTSKQELLRQNLVF